MSRKGAQPHCQHPVWALSSSFLPPVGKVRETPFLPPEHQGSVSAHVSDRSPDPDAVRGGALERVVIRRRRDSSFYPLELPFRLLWPLTRLFFHH